MASDPIFWLKVVDKRGDIVTVPGGSRLERDLIDAMVEQILGLATTVIMSDNVDQLIERCTAAILAKGVGFGRSAAHVAVDIREGLAETFATEQRLTQQQLYVVNDSYDPASVRERLYEGLRHAVQALKDRTIQVA